MITRTMERLDHAVVLKLPTDHEHVMVALWRLGLNRDPHMYTLGELSAVFSYDTPEEHQMVRLIDMNNSQHFALCSLHETLAPPVPYAQQLRKKLQSGSCRSAKDFYDSYLRRFDPTGGTGLFTVRNCFGRNRYMVRMAGGLECSYGYVNQVLSERNLEQENTIAWTSRNRRYLDFGFWLWYALKKRRVIHMTDIQLLEIAQEAGFTAAMIPTKDIPVDGSFRKSCADNLCGKYNANYSCPPACGTVEEVHRRLFQQEKALVVEMIWDVNGFDDKEFIFSSRNKLNRTVLKLMDQLREAGMEGFCLGYGGCPLCNPCKQSLGEPCAFPGKKISCLSAYCIDVGKLADKCNLPFAWSNERMHLFGLIAFRENA